MKVEEDKWIDLPIYLLLSMWLGSSGLGEGMCRWDGDRVYEGSRKASLSWSWVQVDVEVGVTSYQYSRRRYKNIDPTARRSYSCHRMLFRSTPYCKATECTSKQLEKRLTVVLKTIWSTHKNCSQHKTNRDIKTTSHESILPSRAGDIRTGYHS